MAKVAPNDASAHIKLLRNLCAEAEKLSKAAVDLCQRLQQQIEATRDRLGTSQKPHVPERRRKPRKSR